MGEKKKVFWRGQTLSDIHVVVLFIRQEFPDVPFHPSVCHACMHMIPQYSLSSLTPPTVRLSNNQRRATNRYFDAMREVRSFISFLSAMEGRKKIGMACSFFHEGERGKGKHHGRLRGGNTKS
mmetsp:Transcript_18609/g.37668  ORF Transcript_18609/g.37668 Transcript_18609/m.37668 type:complete len:123 (+) Transcript_18609:1524-1892(+)